MKKIRKILRRTRKLSNLAALGTVLWGMTFLAGCSAGPAEGTSGTNLERQDQSSQSRNGREQGGQEQNGEQITVTLGAVDVTQEMQEAVTIYNAQNGMYHVEIVDYLPEQYDNVIYEAAEDRLRMELATGNELDVVCLSGLVVDELGYAGVLLDLNTFLTTEEKEQKYLGNILECAQTGKALYEMSPGFTVAFIAGDGSRLGMETGWTMEEMMGCFAQCGKDGSALAKGGVRTVARLVEYSIEDFVDWNTGKADFCNEEFYRVLEFGKKTDNSEFVRPTRESVAEGTHLASCEGLGDTAGVQYLHWLFGENMAVKGYPCSQGTGVCVSFDRRDSLGISAYSQCPEGAWDFLKFFVEADWIAELDRNGYTPEFSRVIYGFPVSRKLFEKMLEQSMIQQYYEDTGEPYPLYQGEGDVPDFYANTAEDVELLREIIGLADRRCFDSESAISRIIEEEIGGYNDGILTAEQTAEKIQNRVQLYLDEQR